MRISTDVALFAVVHFLFVVSHKAVHGMTTMTDDYQDAVAERFHFFITLITDRFVCAWLESHRSTWQWIAGGGGGTGGRGVWGGGWWCRIIFSALHIIILNSTDPHSHNTSAAAAAATKGIAIGASLLITHHSSHIWFVYSRHISSSLNLRNINTFAFIAKSE